MRAQFGSARVWLCLGVILATTACSSDRPDQWQPSQFWAAFLENDGTGASWSADVNDGVLQTLTVYRPAKPWGQGLATREAVVITVWVDAARIGTFSGRYHISSAPRVAAILKINRIENVGAMDGLESALRSGKTVELHRDDVASAQGTPLKATLKGLDRALASAS